MLLMIWIFPLSGAQEAPADTMAVKRDSVRAFALKPVASISLGVLNYYGDVRNSLNGPSIGHYAAQVNLSAYLDPNRHYVANF